MEPGPAPAHAAAAGAGSQAGGVEAMDEGAACMDQRVSFKARHTAGCSRTFSGILKDPAVKKCSRTTCSAPGLLHHPHAFPILKLLHVCSEIATNGKKVTSLACSHDLTAADMTRLEELLGLSSPPHPASLNQQQQQQEQAHPLHGHWGPWTGPAGSSSDGECV
eukprot:scaffold263409_cov15-Tisochrysis_lutea.AAC.1